MKVISTPGVRSPCIWPTCSQKFSCEPNYFVTYLQLFLQFSAIIHLELAQDFVDGCRSARCPFARISNPQRTQFFRIWLNSRLHAVAQPHAAHHRHWQETEQNNSQYQPGLYLVVSIWDLNFRLSIIFKFHRHFVRVGRQVDRQGIV